MKEEKINKGQIITEETNLIITKAGPINAGIGFEKNSKDEKVCSKDGNLKVESDIKKNLKKDEISSIIFN